MSARPPSWWWVALAAGTLLRAFLALATEGTYDVPIWETHARLSREHGLVGYYARSEVFNHPPLAAWLVQRLWLFALIHDLPFAALLRGATSVVDLGNALLLLALLPGGRARFALSAGYWLSPLAIVFSAYHGNTDSAVPTFALLALLAVRRRSPLLSGAALGLGLSIKLPVLLAAPVLFLAWPGARERGLFVAALGLVGAAGYLPVLLSAPDLLLTRVFSYAGVGISTPGGTPIWGLWSLFGAPDALPAPWASLARLHLEHNNLAIWIPILALAWLRREQRSLPALGTGICASICLLYGFTHSPWAFQYAAWIAPFLFFAGPGFAALATLTLGGYVYGVYVFLTGSPMLLGAWDWNGHPVWPAPLLAWRNLAQLTTTAAATAFLIQAARQRVKRVPRAA